MEDYWTECQYYGIVRVCFMFGNCSHCCFCCGHAFTMLGVSLFISCKNKIQCVCVCVCVWKKENPKFVFFFKYSWLIKVLCSSQVYNIVIQYFYNYKMITMISLVTICHHTKLSNSKNLILYHKRYLLKAIKT